MDRGLERAMRRAYAAVAEAAAKYSTSLRGGAYAVGRVAEATRIRGIFP